MKRLSINLIICLIYFSNTSCISKDFTIKRIHENTPLVFQWFVMRNSKFIFEDDQIPIPNNNQYPYLDNIKRAASIEKDRKVIVFCDGFSKSQKIKAKLIEREFNNLKFVYKNQLDFSKFDKPYNEIQKKNLETACKDDYELIKDNTKKYTTLFSLHTKGHSHFDLFRNLLLLKGAAVLQEIGISDKNVKPTDGLVYLDCDFKINEKIGAIDSLDGISIYSDNGENIENGFIAVDRPNHPALLKGLEILHSDVCAEPFFDGVCKGIKDYFIPHRTFHSLKKEKLALVKKIRFESSNVDMNTSQSVGSSWNF